MSVDRCVVKLHQARFYRWRDMEGSKLIAVVVSRGEASSPQWRMIRRGHCTWRWATLRLHGVRGMRSVLLLYSKPPSRLQVVSADGNCKIILYLEADSTSAINSILLSQ